MDGSAELLQLAHLLRTGASAAREIAAIYERDVEAIERLAYQAERIARDLEAIVGGTGDGIGSRSN